MVYRNIQVSVLARRCWIPVVLSLLAACSEPPASGDANDPCCAVTITATVPDDTPTLYLTGNQPAFGPWRPDKYPMQGEGAERTAEITIPRGTEFEYKFTLGNWDREALGHAGAVAGNHRLRVSKDEAVRHDIPAFKQDPGVYMKDWRASGVQGTLVYWPDVESEYLGPARHVVIWLPPGFEADADTRYPVLYMHDGQNLFDPRFGNNGEIWDVDDAIVRLMEEDAIPPVIVVGVFNTADRGAEYSPWHRAPDYAKFLIEELMPRVNAEFPTLTGPEHTAVMGSSMGGLLSYYLVTQHPEVFGACGCVSSHFSLSPSTMAKYFPAFSAKEKPDKTPYIMQDIEKGLTIPKGVRLWFDYGTRGLDAEYDKPHKVLRKALLELGLEEGEDFVMRKYRGADHNEASWRERLEDPLRFLFGKQN